MSNNTICCQGLDFSVVNRAIHAGPPAMELTDCCGQRFLAAGTDGKNLSIHGVPGNALGAYLNGGCITVYGNAQDATGDTMNDGSIIIHGCCGDAAGYAMRGGEIFIKEDVGYRAGIHMKAYAEKSPALIIGGGTGSFLGEYQAGGLILVLGLWNEDFPLASFYGTGMHGGRLMVRARRMPENLPAQLSCRPADEADKKQIAPYITRFCTYFNVDPARVYSDDRQFYTITPNTSSPYKRLYVAN